MVVAQLVKRSLAIPEVHGFNPVIGRKFNLNNLFIVNCFGKTTINEKEARIFFKNLTAFLGERLMSEIVSKQSCKFFSPESSSPSSSPSST